MQQITTSIKKMVSLFVLAILLFSTKAADACNANFTHTNTCAGDTVWFYAVDQYAVYTWDFGDSTSQTNINHDTLTYHVYTTPGTYIVTLFVNIGAEWDYNTQVITIGTDCFHADFTTACGGGLFEYFYNNSIGSTSVFWDFGDAASGANNFSTIDNPYHTYPSNGNYTVTMITGNGVIADTVTQTVTVSTTCIAATIYDNIFGNCSGDTTHFNVYYTGTITSYSWNFDDPSSGADNFSTLAVPTHIYASTGWYNVQLIISNGVAIDTINKVVIVRDCSCWPGDCNTDGEVNGDDIFPIGMFYGNQGNVRTGASNNFTSQPSTDWPNWGDMMYLQTMANAKQADCNGDGTINNLDVVAINTNYGLHHNNHNNRSGMPEATILDPTMYIQFSAGSATAGSTVTATIYLGTANIPVNYLYGYSFSVLYDAAMVVPGSASINLTNNWLGDGTNELTITHDNYAEGTIDAGVVRFDKVQVPSGFGAIGTVSFQLQNNASGNFHLSLAPSAKMLSTTQFNNTNSGVQEVFRPFNLLPADLLVMGSVGINSNIINSSISIYPNPANELLTIDSGNLIINEVSILNSLGQVVYRNNENYASFFQIKTADLKDGIYTLQCKTKEGIVVKKINIVN